MAKKRKMVMVPLNDEQRAILRPLLNEIERANRDLKDSAVFAQVWADGLVATVCTEDEVYGVQQVLEPSNPWRWVVSAADRMAKA